jgi:hypothetical protein
MYLCAGHTLVVHTCDFGGVDTKIRLLDALGVQVLYSNGTEVVDDDTCSLSSKLLA